MKYIELQTKGKGNGQYLAISTFFLNPDQQAMVIACDIKEVGEAILLQDGPEFESVPGGKLSEQNRVMRTNLTVMLLNDGFPFRECPDPAIIIVTRKNIAKPIMPKLSRPKLPKASKRLPLYQAINEYFNDWFRKHPAADQAVITDLNTLQAKLKSRFKIKYTIRGLRKLVEADCYLVPGEGYGFKRSDFYIPSN